MTGLMADLTHAWRLYRRTPGSSLIAVLVLAVAMAFVSAFLSLYVDLVLKPHAGFEASSRIVTLGQSDGRQLTGLPRDVIERITEETSTLDAVAGFLTTSVALGEDGERKPVELVTREFFGGLRPRLFAGRGFTRTEHEADAEPVAVISYAYWQDAFDGDPAVLGTTMELELQPMMIMSGPAGVPEPPEPPEYRIVGIMSPAMTGLMADEVALWLPFERAAPQIVIGPSVEQMLSRMTMRALGRRSDGASTSAVVSEIRTRYADLGTNTGPQVGFAVPGMQEGFRPDAIDGVVRDLNVQRDSRRHLQLFLGASVLLALVAAANVSLFLLARAPGRRRELGIRMAVGAPLKRLGRQLASEAGFLVVAAAVLGMIMSVWLSQFLSGLAFLRQAQWTNISLLDWRVLGLVGIFLLLLTLLVSLAPILGLKRLGIAASSRQVAARASVAQKIAGTLQIAIAGTLGGAAVAFGWYLGGLVFGDPGYTVRDLYTADFQLDFNLLRDGRNIQNVLEMQVVEMARRREAIEAIPGVTAVAFGRPVPGQTGRAWTQMPDPNDPSEQIQVTTGSVDSRYVDVLGLRLLHGRAPTEDDIQVALVNQAFAQAFFGRDNVVGESVATSPVGLGQQTEIIGVLEDLSFQHPSAEVEPILFRTQNQSLSATAIVRSSLTAAALQRELERIADLGEIEVRLNNFNSLQAMRSSIVAPDRARGLLTIGTAALVVVLAALGFYGTQRYLVTAGRREYAIRASLGAGPRALGRLVFRRGLVLSLPGLVVGALCAFILVSWLRDAYVSRDISSGVVTLGVAAGLTALLLAASLGPATQARRTQPAPLLREE